MTSLLFVLIIAALIAVDLLVSRARRNSRREYAKQPNAPYRHCPLCGEFLEMKDVAGRLRMTCVECGFVHWDNPKPVTITLIPMDDGLVLIRRKVNPAAGSWALPGGFIEGYEKPHEAAAREVLEECGLKVEIDRLLGAFPPRSGVNQVILLYLARPAVGTPVPGDDAIDAQVFHKDDLPTDIAFPLHREAIRRFFEGSL